MLRKKKSNPNSLDSIQADRIAPVDGCRQSGARAANHGDGYAAIDDAASALAHASKRLTVDLNDNWGVIEKSEQWILRRRRGKPRTRNAGWECCAFFRTRAGLLLRIREVCGPVAADAQAIIDSLPEVISHRQRRYTQAL